MTDFKLKLFTKRIFRNLLNIPFIFETVPKMKIRSMLQSLYKDLKIR